MISFYYNTLKEQQGLSKDSDRKAENQDQKYFFSLRIPHSKFHYSYRLLGISFLHV